jgi:hypothetical protein
MRIGHCALGVMVLLLSLPAAAAQTRSTIEPAEAEPGATLHLLFAPGDTGLLGIVQVDVLRSITCSITGPNGTVVATCTGAPTLIDAQVAPGDEAYAWDLPAPAEPGNYTVTFQKKTAISLPATSPASTARFQVRSLAEPLTPGSTQAASPGESKSLFGRFFAVFVGTSAAAATNGASAGTRWLISLLVGSAALLALLFAQRHGGGP